MARKDRPRYRDQKPPLQFAPSQNETDFNVNKAFIDPKKRVASALKEINDRAFQYYSCLQRLDQFVEVHHAEDISLHTAARIAGLEKKYFSAFFHRKVGITYTRWLTIIRVKKAMDLIKTADDSLTHIASKAGFGDLRTFERSFKKLTALTPLEFKKTVRPS